MTTVTFDVSYGTRAVPFRLPYLSVRRRRPAVALAVAAASVAERRDAHRERTAAARRAVADALAGRDAATTRALASRAGLPS